MYKLQTIFNQLKKLLKKHAKGTVIGRTTWPSQTKFEKPGYGLYSKRDMSIMGRKAQPTYIAGIILQKHFVGFYSMGVYSHPKLITKLSPDTKKMLKGKSCFNVKKLDKQIMADLDNIIKETIKTYKKEKWI